MQDPTTLDLSNKNLADKDVPMIIDKLKTNHMINKLDLSSNKIGNKGITELLKSPYVHNIDWLILRNNCLGDEGAVATVQSSHNNNIACLDLSQNDLTAEGIKLMAQYIPGSKLCCLHFSGENDLSAALAVMDAARRHPQLHDLICPFSIQELMMPLMLENRKIVNRTMQSLLALITELNEFETLDYPIRNLDRNILMTFETYYFNKLLVRPLTRSAQRIKMCKKINNYINNNYFKITGVIQNNMELEDKEVRGVTLLDLPADVLRLITRSCYISDVKHDGDREPVA